MRDLTLATIAALIATILIQIIIRITHLEYNTFTTIHLLNTFTTIHLPEYNTSIHSPPLQHWAAQAHQGDGGGAGGRPVRGAQGGGAPGPALHKVRITGH